MRKTANAHNRHQPRSRGAHAARTQTYLLVRVQRLFRGRLALVAVRKLRQIAVIVARHLVVEHFRLAARRRWNQIVLQYVKDVAANLVQLLLDLRTILLNLRYVIIVALGHFLLLNRRNDTPRRTARTNYVLVRNRQQVPFFDRQLPALLCNHDRTSVRN